ncbi:Zinc finger matrin-type protein 3 [Chelonia mydas]|uniref:Zinc finger matrin-type protein 3 n=1 Tax=Chelonia mydas TaxID=8469 RepID=M7BKJ9_CHEMY|nr:Zinc finger matrin-type protein 3 [Chelonia mydas]
MASVNESRIIPHIKMTIRLNSKQSQELKKSLPPSTVTCQQSSQPMILLQQAGLPPHPRPEKPSSPPMSVATRPRANSPLSPQKPFGLGPSLQHSQEEELAKDPVLEELCKPLCCKLCNVTLNSAQQAQAHYQGKNHSKKLRNYYAANSCPAPARMSNSVEPAVPQIVSHPAQMGASKPGGRVIMATENDYCKLCDASFSSPAVAQAHYQGKNHAKRLRLAEAQSNSFPDTSELGKRRARKEGNDYKMMQNRRNVYAVQNSTGPYFNPRSRQRIPRDLAMCVTPSGQYYCSMCNAGASEEMEFRQHLESKQHKSKVSEQSSSLHFGGALSSPMPCCMSVQGPRSTGTTTVLPCRQGPYFNPRSRQRIPRDLAMCVTPSGQYYCSMCNAGASEEMEFRQHLESKQHKSKVSEQRYRNEMENLGYVQ